MYTSNNENSCPQVPIVTEQSLKAEQYRQNAPFLGKWLWLLFLLIIPSLLASIMTNSAVLAQIPTLAIPGQILDIAVLIAYGLILLKISTVNEYYRTAGICTLISSAAAAVIAFSPAASAVFGWGFAVLAIAVIVALVGEYHEYVGHSRITAALNEKLSHRWETLWA